MKLHKDLKVLEDKDLHLQTGPINLIIWAGNLIVLTQLVDALDDLMPLEVNPLIVHLVAEQTVAVSFHLLQTKEVPPLLIEVKKVGESDISLGEALSNVYDWCGKSLKLTSTNVATFPNRCSQSSNQSFRSSVNCSLNRPLLVSSP